MDDTFYSFCRRMWLDYCDEHSSFGSTTLTEKEYIKKYNKWLLQKYAKIVEERNELTK
tara:strand:- start:2755 stop:2928 length:174 start_codon:yes stop_codon:yes gene_type:complete